MEKTLKYVCCRDTHQDERASLILICCVMGGKKKRVLWKHTHLARLRIHQVLNLHHLHCGGVRGALSVCLFIRVFSGICTIFQAYNMLLSLALIFQFWYLLPEENY